MRAKDNDSSGKHTGDPVTSQEGVFSCTLHTVIGLLVSVKIRGQTVSDCDRTETNHKMFPSAVYYLCKTQIKINSLFDAHCRTFLTGIKDEKSYTSFFTMKFMVHKRQVSLNEPHFS